MTCSVGANKNSASLSTNLLMSHGQATRSTCTCSRVIHFISCLLSTIFGYGFSAGRYCTSEIHVLCHAPALPSPFLFFNRGRGSRQRKIQTFKQRNAVRFQLNLTHVRLKPA